MLKIPVALATSAILVFALAACGGKPEPTATPTPLPPTEAPTAAPQAPVTATSGTTSAELCGPGTAPSYITAFVLAREAQGQNYTPVGVSDELASDQATLHAIATLENAPSNTALRSVWYLLNATGYTPNTRIDDHEVNVTQGGSRNIDFTLTSDTGTWPPGAYCVELYADGNLALSRQFTISASGAAPAPSGASPVVQVVLAEDAKPDTFEPVNPATTFKANAPAIHVTVQIKDAPTGTRFRARWYPPSQDPLDFELVTDGSRWMDFRLTPAPDGFPIGEYQVEIYVNDELVETLIFNVE